MNYSEGKLRWKSNVGGWDEDDSGTWKAAAAATMWQRHRCVRQFNGGHDAQAQLKTC